MLKVILALPWLLATLLFAGEQKVQVVPHIFDPYATNRGQLEASWVKNPGKGPAQVLFLRKATKSSDPGIPYATVNGAEGLRLRELGYEVATKKSPGFKGGHCGVSPNIEITLTNHTSYSFRCEKGRHIPIGGTIWERVRFRNEDAIPISCTPTPKCQMKPWPGFGAPETVVAHPPNDDPKSFTFLIIMMDGLDYDPDFTGTVYMNKLDINGSLIRDAGSHPVDSDAQ